MAGRKLWQGGKQARGETRLGGLVMATELLKRSDLVLLLKETLQVPPLHQDILLGADRQDVFRLPQHARSRRPVRKRRRQRRAPVHLPFCRWVQQSRMEQRPRLRRREGIEGASVGEHFFIEPSQKVGRSADRSLDLSLRLARPQRSAAHACGQRTCTTGAGLPSLHRATKSSKTFWTAAETTGAFAIGTGNMLSSQYGDSRLPEATVTAAIVAAALPAPPRTAWRRSGRLILLPV